MIATNREKAEFKLYLQQCTDAQVVGVYEKEKKARRRQYAALAAAEATRRGIDLD